MRSATRRRCIYIYTCAWLVRCRCIYTRRCLEILTRRCYFRLRCITTLPTSDMNICVYAYMKFSKNAGNLNFAFTVGAAVGWSWPECFAAALYAALSVLRWSETRRLHATDFTGGNTREPWGQGHTLLRDVLPGKRGNGCRVWYKLNIENILKFSNNEKQDSLFTIARATNFLKIIREHFPILCFQLLEEYRDSEQGKLNPLVRLLRDTPSNTS